MRQLRNGITSYNCGDWVESCTALAKDFNGHVSILETQVKRPARAVPERRPATYVPAPSGPIIIAPPAMRDAVNGAFPVTQCLPVRDFAPRAAVLSAARLTYCESGSGASENWPQLR